MGIAKEKYYKLLLLSIEVWKDMSNRVLVDSLGMNTSFSFTLIC